MKPKLSICIPTYNRANCLRETIESIITQATEEVEIVISDNASSDNTEEVVEQYRRIYPTISYYRHPENVGADRNYLKVVELATGEYCWLFGSDDIMKEHAITKMLSEIKSGADVYLCGLTLCTLDMTPIETHRVLKINLDKVFNLGNEEERRSYFELAETTTAFFSFLGSLIVRKQQWDAVTIDEGLFIGSLWSHVAKIFGMLPKGLVLKYLHEPLLNKRGDNDSFVDKGVVNRYKVQIDGYHQMGNYFFGPNSFESFHIRRVVRNELPLYNIMQLKQQCMKDGNREGIAQLSKLVSTHFSNSTFKYKVCKLIYDLAIFQWMIDSYLYLYTKIKNRSRY